MDTTETMQTQQPMISPMISIVLPTYHSAQRVEDSINSVLKQTYENWELIIVDDASQDDTPAVIQRYADADKRIKCLFSKTNQGAGETRNLGIDAARGRYLAFLDSGDLWESDKLSRQLDFMQKNNYAFTFTKGDFFDENGKFLGETIKTADKLAYRDVLKHCCISTPTVMLDTTQFNRIRMPALRQGEDHALWLSLLEQTPYVYRIPVVLSHFLIWSGALSSNKLHKARMQWRVYRQALGLSLIPSAWYWLHYAFYGTVKWATMATKRLK